jgi:hypothetical protein
MREPSAPPPLPESRNPSKWPWAVAALVAVLLLAATALLFVRDRGQKEFRAAAPRPATETKLARQPDPPQSTPGKHEPKPVEGKQPQNDAAPPDRLDADGFYQQARLKWRNGDDVGTMRDLNSAIRLDEKHARSYVLRFCLHVEAQEYEEAQKDAERGHAKDGDDLCPGMTQQEKDRLKRAVDAQNAWLAMNAEAHELVNAVKALPPDEQTFAREIIKKLRAEDFSSLEEMDLEKKGATDRRIVTVGQFILDNTTIFKVEEHRNKIFKWAEWAGVDELIQNLKVTDRERLMVVKLYFAFLDNAKSKIVTRAGPGGRPEALELVLTPRGWETAHLSSRRADKEMALRVSRAFKKDRQTQNLGLQSPLLSDRMLQFMYNHAALFKEVLEN